MRSWFVAVGVVVIFISISFHFPRNYVIGGRVFGGVFDKVKLSCVQIQKVSVAAIAMASAATLFCFLYFAIYTLQFTNNTFTHRIRIGLLTTEANPLLIGKMQSQFSILKLKVTLVGSKLGLWLSHFSN